MVGKNKFLQVYLNHNPPKMEKKNRKTEDSKDEL